MLFHFFYKTETFFRFHLLGKVERYACIYLQNREYHYGIFTNSLHFQQKEYDIFSKKAINLTEGFHFFRIF